MKYKKFYHNLINKLVEKFPKIFRWQKWYSFELSDELIKDLDEIENVEISVPHKKIKS